MSRARGFAAACCVAASAMLSLPAGAGGNNDQWDLTGSVPSPFPGEFIGVARGYRWDDRCIPAPYHINASIDPIPNGAGFPPISLAETTEGLLRAFETWNGIPTSYIEMRVVGNTQTTAPPGVDFVNEVSFRWPPDIAAVGFSPATVLLADSDFVHGEDLDGDGDADVSSAIVSCTDTDGDGDFEFPAGSYQAGTILENDVMLNPAARFTVDGSGLDNAQTYDLVGVAAHELGHSHGLAHSGIVQKSPRDGTAATMYNALRDAADKLAMRTLWSDDIAWSSFLYPEGSRRQGAGALQDGDRRFDDVYSVIRGEVRNAAGQPVVGSVIFAEDLHGNVVASSIAGHARASVDLANADPFSIIPFQLLPPELGIIDSQYALPVPKGIYKVGIEPNDGAPEPTAATRVAAIGYLNGSQSFTEEYWNGRAEGRTEHRLGQALPVPASNNRDEVDFVLDDSTHILEVNSLGDGYGIGLGPDGILLAKRIPRDKVLAADRGRGLLIQAATLFTFAIDTTPVAKFDAAMIATGQIAADGSVSVDVKHPLVRQAPFIGQDFDFTPLYVDKSLALGLYAKYVLPQTGKDLFVVLDFPRDEYPGFPGISKYSILLDLLEPGETDFAGSYYSIDGGVTWIRDAGVEYVIGLVVAPR